MEIKADIIKELRDKTGAPIMDCKKALIHTNGNIEKAIEFLRMKGLASLKKREGKVTSEGAVGSYIHAGGKIGVLIEVNCETDFVARTEDFKNFVKDIAMQIAATNPLYLSREDIPEEELNKEKEFLKTQALESGKPEKIVEKIVEGRLEKFYSEVCLLDQPFIKDENMTVNDLLGQIMGKVGERIIIRRFVRYFLGETSKDQ
jgi:elongation factor Ts